MTDHSRETVHVCLISDQLIPNLLPLLAENPVAVHAVISKERAALGARFCDMLKDLFGDRVTISMTKQAPSTDMTALRAIAASTLADIRRRFPQHCIVVNATGGTKPMAIAFAVAARELEGPYRVIYTDSGKQCVDIWFASDENNNAWVLPELLDARSYLRAQGMRLNNCVAARGPTRDVWMLQRREVRARIDAAYPEDWLTRYDRRLAVTHLLGNNAGGYQELIKAFNRAAFAALSRVEKTQDATDFIARQLLTSADGRHAKDFPIEWTTILDMLTSSGVLKRFESGYVEFADVSSARYLNGHWLEEYVWDVLQSLAPHDAVLGAHGAWSQDVSAQRHPGNEFDLLAVHRNSLLVIECKTGQLAAAGNKAQDVVHKLNSLGTDAGGLFGRSLLVSALPLNADIRARAKIQRIETIEADNIKAALPAYLRKWMGLPIPQS